MYRCYKQLSQNIRMDEGDYNFCDIVKECMIKEFENGDPFLTAEDIEEILKEDPDITDDSPRENIFGYPTRPLYREIANVLQRWMETRHCPILDLPSYNLLDEKDYVENRAAMIKLVTPQLESMSSLWKTWSSDERIYRLRGIIQLLGKRGLLDILGVRKTVGSVDSWPAPKKTIIATFQARHKPDSAAVLTVGARALSKHCHRDETSSWWGNCTGTEAAKNEHAENLLHTILGNATWINIHGLPHDVKVLEVRHEEGYGVRWSSDGLQFRGFLEPQMVDGHAVGWRH